MLNRTLGLFHEATAVVNSLVGDIQRIAGFGPAHCQLKFETSRTLIATTIFTLTSLSTPLLAQGEPQSGAAKSIQDSAEISQARGVDQRVDYQSLTKYGPWDDRNYDVTLEDLALIPEKDQYLRNVPVFFKISMRKEQPELGEFYPRSTLQRFQILHGGLLVNGVLYKEGLGIGYHPDPVEKRK